MLAGLFNIHGAFCVFYASNQTCRWCQYHSRQWEQRHRGRNMWTYEEKSKHLASVRRGEWRLVNWIRTTLLGSCHHAKELTLFCDLLRLMWHPVKDGVTDKPDRGDQLEVVTGV